MPRRSVSAFTQLQRHAQRLIVGLGTEIRTRKAELIRLEQEFEQLTGIAGLRGSGIAKKTPLKRVAARGRRINWSEVLAKLPKEFKASDIRRIRGLKDKRASELFAAITRWIDVQAVKKKARGVYLRLK